MNKKLIFIAVLFFAIIVFGGLFFYLKRAENHTNVANNGNNNATTTFDTGSKILAGANGKMIYRNEKYGFEFEYPQDLSFQERYSSVFGFLVQATFERVVARDGGSLVLDGGFIINIDKRTPSNDFLTIDGFKTWRGVGGLISIDKVKIGQLDAIKIEVGDKANGTTEWIYFTNGDFVISFAKGDIGEIMNKAAFDEVLNSLRFIN